MIVFERDRADIEALGVAATHVELIRLELVDPIRFVLKRVQVMEGNSGVTQVQLDLYLLRRRISRTYMRR